MKTYIKLVFALFTFMIVMSSCFGDKNSETNKKLSVIKGLYSFGPEIRTFTNCEDSKEYWVVDSAKTLELGYFNLGFEKPYTPVYVEVECHFVKSDTTLVADFDSTMVVTKVLKISKQIPDGPCSQ